MGWDLPASTPGVQLSTASSGCGPASMEEAWKALLKQAVSRLKQKFGWWRGATGAKDRHRWHAGPDLIILGTFSTTFSEVDFGHRFLCAFSGFWGPLGPRFGGALCMLFRHSFR